MRASDTSFVRSRVFAGDNIMKIPRLVVDAAAAAFVDVDMMVMAYTAGTFNSRDRCRNRDRDRDRDRMNRVGSRSGSDCEDCIRRKLLATVVPYRQGRE